MQATTGVIEVWTDGACLPNPGTGGWAWVTREGQQGCGREEPSTNQRMEMTAVLRAIETLGPLCRRLVIYTDSMFVINGCTSWLRNWKARGWTKADGGAVANLELWRMLDEALNSPGHGSVEFKWVAGHSGDEMNEKADVLAGQATGLSQEERAKHQRQMAHRSAYKRGSYRRRR